MYVSNFLSVEIALICQEIPDMVTDFYITGGHPVLYAENKVEIDIKSGIETKFGPSAIFPIPESNFDINSANSEKDIK